MKREMCLCALLNTYIHQTKVVLICWELHWPYLLLKLGRVITL